MFWPSSKSHQMLSKCQYAICCFNVNSQKNTWENGKEFGKRLKTSLEKDFLPLPATALLRSDASEKPEASRYRIRWLGNLRRTKTIDDPNLQKAPKATWSLAKTWSFGKQNEGPGVLQNCAAGKTLKMSEKSLCLEANIEKPNVRVSTYTMNVHDCQVLQIFAWVPGEFNDIPPRGLMRICRRKELREEIRHESIRSDDQRLRCTAWNTRWIFSLRLLL